MAYFARLCGGFHFNKTAICGKDLDMENPISGRPRGLSRAAATIAATEVVELMIKGGQLSERDRTASISDVVTCGSLYIDGYELAKKLDDDHGWDCDFDMCEILNGFAGAAQDAMEKEEKAWAETNNIQPPYPVGTRVTYAGTTGVIDEIYRYGVARYSIKEDGDPKAEAPTNRRRIFKYEDVIATPLRKLSHMTQPEQIDVDALANEIRRLDGNHDMGAGALAEALVPFLTSASPAPSDGEVTETDIYTKLLEWRLDELRSTHAAEVAHWREALVEWLDDHGITPVSTDPEGIIDQLNWYTKALAETVPFTHAADVASLREESASWQSRHQTVTETMQRRGKIIDELTAEVERLKRLASKRFDEWEEKDREVHDACERVKELEGESARLKAQIASATVYIEEAGLSPGAAFLIMSGPTDNDIQWALRQSGEATMGEVMTADDKILNTDPFEGDYGEPGDRTLSNKMVVARKAHTCQHCAGPVSIGERHRHQVEIFDGEMHSLRFCAECCAAMVEDWDGNGDVMEARIQLHARPHHA